eukprot:CAMPEP_0167793464 /NCGR_PEP_ID=MMETSP0111_2-20121227/13205_1 /TAXON_ID=91324 /ORGANISM="Lotharella globosa, Strain CCCM811" /LENGTH=735 /DNA_ID=CAMNT_0007686645 /DNA_START=29 /DNA_END=2236 /DNA_ORIENTATION=-
MTPASMTYLLALAALALATARARVVPKGSAVGGCPGIRGIRGSLRRLRQVPARGLPLRGSVERRVSVRSTGGGEGPDFDLDEGWEDVTEDELEMSDILKDEGGFSFRDVKTGKEYVSLNYEGEDKAADPVKMPGTSVEGWASGESLPESIEGGGAPGKLKPPLTKNIQKDDPAGEDADIFDNEDWGRFPTKEELSEFGVSDEKFEEVNKANELASELRSGGSPNVAGIKVGGALDSLLEEIIEEERDAEDRKERELEEEVARGAAYSDLTPEVERVQTPEDDLDKEIAGYAAMGEPEVPTEEDLIQYTDSELVDVDDGDAKPTKKMKEAELQEMLSTKTVAQVMEDQDFQKRLMETFDWDEDIDKEEEDLLLKDVPEGPLDEFIADMWMPKAGDWVKIQGLGKATQYNNQTGVIIESPQNLNASANVNVGGDKEMQRFVVKLQDSKKIISVRKKNLEYTLSPEKAAEEARERAARREAEKYFQIFATAGNSIEARIKEHRDRIDDRLLQMISNRIETEEAQDMKSEVDASAIRGLKLLHKRLKKELDRAKATPSLRLLDECLDLYQISDTYERRKTSSRAGSGLDDDEKLDEFSATEQVKDKLRVAFFGSEAIDKALGGDGDLLTLAQVVATPTGRDMVKSMFNEQLDPERFMEEVSQVLQVASKEQETLRKMRQQIEDELKVTKDLTAVQISEVRLMQERIKNELSDRSRILRCIALILDAADELRRAGVEHYG